MSGKSALLSELGVRFRALREEQSMTQQALAARSKVSRDTIHRLERGDVVDVSSLVRLLDGLGQRVAFTKKVLRAADMRRLVPEVHEDAE